MINKNAAVLRSAFIGSALSILSIAQSTSYAESEPNYRSSAEANSKLQHFCSTDRLKTFKGHAECLQETSGQAWQFAESFHASLFTKQGLPADASYYPNMIAAWTKTIAKRKLPNAEQDLVALKNYAHQCHDIMQESIFTPEIALRFSYTTGYNIPKGCVDTALYFSDKYKVQIDKDEAKRLQNHIKSIYHYYATNPSIPAEEAEVEMTPPMPMIRRYVGKTWDI